MINMCDVYNGLFELLGRGVRHIGKGAEMAFFYVFKRVFSVTKIQDLKSTID